MSGRRERRSPVTHAAHVIPRSAVTGNGAMASRDSIADVWGPRTPYVGEWPTRPDIRTTGPVERWVPSVCVLCSTLC